MTLRTFLSAANLANETSRDLKYRKVPRAQIAAAYAVAYVYTHLHACNVVSCPLHSIATICDVRIIFANTENISHALLCAFDTAARTGSRTGRFMTNVLRAHTRAAGAINCEKCRYVRGWTHGKRSVACRVARSARVAHTPGSRRALHAVSIRPAHTYQYARTRRIDTS